jgi:hypothetical protein
MGMFDKIWPIRFLDRGERLGLVLGHRGSVSKRWRKYAPLKGRNTHLPHGPETQKKTTNLSKPPGKPEN